MMEAHLNNEYAYSIPWRTGAYSHVADMWPWQVHRAPNAHTTDNGWRVRRSKARCGCAARRARTVTASWPTSHARREVPTVRPFPLLNPYCSRDSVNDAFCPGLNDVNRYLQERRFAAEQSSKRSADETLDDGAQGTSMKRPRGRPKGSKNRVGKALNGGGQAPEAVST